MERLTERDEFGNADIIGVSSGDFQLRLDFDEFNRVTDALNRLAAYEDTGMEPEDIKKAFNEEVVLKLAAQALGTTPERLREMAKARNEGRAVVLPCKVGEWLYYLLDDKVRKAKVEEIQCSAYKHNPQFKVTVFAWDFSAKEQLTYCPAGDSWIGNNRGFVRVFLTPAEAEAAISAQKGDPHETDPV